MQKVLFLAVKDEAYIDARAEVCWSVKFRLHMER